MNTIDMTVTIDQPMPAAQDLILDRVDQRLRGAGLTRHSQPGGDVVEYRPRFVGLALLWMIRRMSGEGVTFTFDRHGTGTEVHATGKLRNRANLELTDALGGN